MTRTNHRTLVLNQGYEPIRVINWERAITMVWLEKATVLTEYSFQVHSKHLAWNIPAVIWLRKKAKRFVPQVKLTRHYIYARDGWVCQYCGERFKASELTFDHVLPRSRGGRTTWENIATSCIPCNQRKEDRTPEEAGMPLLRKPRKPKWMPALLAKSLNDRTVPQEWNDYIGWLRPS